MYRLHYWPTPNGHKVTLFLEEIGANYEIAPVNIRAGDQFRPEYLKIAPNNRMPALEDLETGVHLFESGAILLYLAEKHESFIPTASHAQGRAEVLQWLFWQMAGLGPMMGQAGHFRFYAPEQIPYAIERYTNETLRLLNVMDKRLTDRPFLAGADYSIADMASFPWAKFGVEKYLEGNPLPNLERWVKEIAARPATARAYAIGERPEYQQGEPTEEEKKRLFHQGPQSVQR
ncbi:glutathione S-transferase N-terminal domain-containing protein [Sandaracinobacter sp. RS1-74]|uniref:glutathione S-transferase N-terminal domain-containing protein n=1 Tax=Sandaracinobacteroides sayramensis TaxID=2913411 RepID=UPI001ED9D1AF|nr:glutathione S-transferase N-terminal domain-containing protein [Sandaracinobacteroides sayramensis]MCG2842711.1 glutathione S-transferase N-terminal domain-containing protein [Sandaracinobacteroides sayramensis]